MTELWSHNILAEKEVVTKSFICQIMIVNKVINFLSIFPQQFA